MFELKVRNTFSASHQLRNYNGECERLHGHNWVVNVFLRGTGLAENGILVDFLLVKKAIHLVLSELDHSHLNDLQPFDTINPSCEHLARYIFECCGNSLKTLGEHNVPIYKVEVFETEDCSASYYDEA